MSSKILLKKRVKFLLAYCKYASQTQELWKEFYKICGNLLVQLEFPLGELFNPAIKGYLFAWDLQNEIHSSEICRKDIFAVQGLEGKAIINVTLITALLVWELLPEFCCQIKIRRDQNKILEEHI